MLEEEKDVRKVVERLKALGHNVEELRHGDELVGVRVGDVYIARKPPSWGAPERWAVAEIPDAELGYRWAVGYRYGSAWGDLSYVQRELEKKMKLEALETQLKQYGYKVRKLPWPNSLGVTYVIEKDGKRIGELSLLTSLPSRDFKITSDLPYSIKYSGDLAAAVRYLIYRHELGPHLERYGGNIGGYSPRVFLEKLALGEIDVKEAERLLTGLEREHAKKAALADFMEWLKKEGFEIKPEYRTETRYGREYLVESWPYVITTIDGKTRYVPKPGAVFVGRGYEWRLEVTDDEIRLVPLRPLADQQPQQQQTQTWQPPSRRLGRGAPLEPLLAGIRSEELARRVLGEVRGGDLQTQIGKTLYGEVPKPAYVPVLSEASHGAFGVDLPAAVHKFATSGPPIQPLPGGGTAPGPRVQGLTLPERQKAEREAQFQAALADRYKNVWTPLDLRPPTPADINWQTAVATGAQMLTFWIPLTKSAAAAAAARGVKVPLLTAERTAGSARVVEIPETRAAYLRAVYTDVGRLEQWPRAVYYAEGPKGASMLTGRPGQVELRHIELVKPTRGLGFEAVSARFVDVADKLKKMPTPTVKVELPRRVKWLEMWGVIPEEKTPKATGVLDDAVRTEKTPPRVTGAVPDEAARKLPGEERPAAGARGAVAVVEEVSAAEQRPPVGRVVVRPAAAELPLPRVSLPAAPQAEMPAVGVRQMASATAALSPPPAALPLRYVSVPAAVPGKRLEASAPASIALTWLVPRGGVSAMPAAGAVPTLGEAVRFSAPSGFADMRLAGETRLTGQMGLGASTLSLPFWGGRGGGGGGGGGWWRPSVSGGRGGAAGGGAGVEPRRGRRRLGWRLYELLRI